MKQTPGAIGYVELIYALQNKLAVRRGEEQGRQVRDALARVGHRRRRRPSAKIPTDFRVSITNAPGADAYPIASFTWLLVHKDAKDAAKAKLVKDFLAWMISPDAQKMAPI